MRPAAAFAVLAALAALQSCSVVTRNSRTVSTQGHRVRLPTRSETRLYELGGDLIDFERMLAITQVGDSVLVRSIGPREAHTWREPTWGGPRTKEGIMPIAEFLTFRDSLDQLGFWRLKDEYSGRPQMEGEVGGYVSIKFQERGKNEISKIVRFYVPRTCPPEFGRVYNLIWGMARFAESEPDSLKGSP